MKAVELFELLASSTWRTIGRASQNGISFGEDAITSINLNAIASLKGGCVAVEDSRVDEAHKGCDFEMWIGNDAAGWHRYAVQAKKIRASRGWRYEKLTHKVRGKPQIEILKDYASKARAAPIYCFYNFAPHVMAFNCKRDADTSQLGCMVLPVGVVEAALRLRGCRQFGWMHMQPEAIPWRCLLTCPPNHNQIENKYARFLWPSPATFRHERLPEQLQAMQEQQLATELMPPHTFGDDAALYYPRWTVIVNTDRRREE